MSQFPRPCLDCGQLTRTPRSGRCPTCNTRRYGRAHQADRQAHAPAVATGTVPCSRCGQLIAPGEPWHLDHRPWGTEPAHAHCNIAAAGEP